MSASAANISALIAREMSVLTNGPVKEALRNGLVDPRPVKLNWNYGHPGQQFDGWIVFDHEAISDTAIVYCDEGFGPKSPWGLIIATPEEGVRWMGMDSGWFRSFMDAFWDSHAATPLIENGQTGRP